MKQQKRLRVGIAYMISVPLIGQLGKCFLNDERQSAIHEFQSLLNKWNHTESEEKGSHALYTVVGQKADFMMMILRPTMEELNEIETEFNKTKLAEFTVPAYSYVSVVELSNYLSSDEDPYQNPAIVARLYPILPKAKHVCFYPMDKRRQGNDNWYMLPMEERTINAQPRYDWTSVCRKS